MNKKIDYKYLIKKYIEPIFQGKPASIIMDNLNDYIPLEKMNQILIEKNRLEEKEKYSSASQEKSGFDSMRGKLLEEIVIWGLNKKFSEDDRNDIFIETKSEMIRKNFYMRSQQNKNLIKKFDVDILLHNYDKKFYCLSVKNSTRERVGQSQSVLFFLDRDAMQVKYGTGNKLFYSPIWEDNREIRYGIVVFDSDGKDYSRINEKTKKEKKNSTREFDVELFSEDRKIGGGFTILNNHKNFRNTINFSQLIGKIYQFFNEK